MADPSDPPARSVDGACVLVTGGAGFIGSHLVRRLIGDGARRIVVLDSLRYGDRANLGDLDRVHVVQHALGTDDDSRLAEHLEGVDYVFHLAAEKHNQSKDSPARVIDANVKGTHALYDAAARGTASRVVFASSLYAYGRLTGPPFVETEVPRPTTVYGMTKLAGEHLLAHFGDPVLSPHRPLEGNVLRYLFVYGPKQFAGMGYKSVIVKSFERLMASEAPTVYGDGEQALDYVYVDDVVDATVRAMTTPLHGRTWNVGSGRATTVNELVDTMIAVSGKSLEKTTGDADWTAGSRRVGDPASIERAIGWKATTSLRSGLERTWRWMNEG